MAKTPDVLTIAPGELDRHIYDTIERTSRQAYSLSTQSQVTIDAYVIQQAAQGVNLEAVLTLISSGGTPVDAVLRANAGRILRVLRTEYETSFTDGMLLFTEKTTGDDEILEWIARPEVSNSGKSCPGCEELNGQRKTKREWYDSGVTPGSGSTVCGGRCNCSLERV